jgi:thymidylate synthase
MNHEEKQYLNLMQNIINRGYESDDRTGVGTFSEFGVQLKFSLENNTIPVFTTKRIFFKGVIEELLFFLRGETNTKILEAKGVNIWKGNTSREFLDKLGLSNYPEGEMGPMYGYMWRNYNGIDQIANAINLIKNDPKSRRIIISAYDPSKAHLTVLDPCHPFFQFHVEDNKLSCQFVMRSNDLFLGAPFNILSYGILTQIIAKTCGLEAGTLTYVCGNAHVYKNHIEQVKLQCSRTPYNFPQLKINKELNSIQDIEALEFKDFEIGGYEYHPAIKAEMCI